MSELSVFLFFFNLKLNESSSELISVLKETKRLKETSSHSMNFEWLDSALVRAVERGEWLLIDNANFCSASVLDRLNPLLEPRGRLQINEKGVQRDGQIPSISAHPRFRLILCMNELFGELSRPMRNRGIEIYVDSMTNEDAMTILLRAAFAFDSASFDYFHSRLQTLHLPFASALRLFKLVNDFWLNADKSLDECFDAALAEFRVSEDVKSFNNEMICEEALPSPIHLKQFQVNAFQLKELEFSRFMFEFPLYSQLISELTELSRKRLNEFHLRSYSELFVSSVKSSQLIEAWLNRIPFGLFNSILKTTYFNLTRNKADVNFIDYLFERVCIKENTKSFISIKETIASLRDSCDLGEENFEIEKNQNLCRKLTMLSPSSLSSILDHVFNLKLEVFLSLAKFRSAKLYHTQNDSLLCLAASLDPTALFLTRFPELFNAFCEDISNCAERVHVEIRSEFYDRVKSCVFLLEKFQLVLTVAYEHSLTIAYLKYFWNFLNKAFSKIQELFKE